MQTVKTWTDAPEAYDGFGTRTVEIVGIHETALGKRLVRLVETPSQHAGWQRSRYESGLYLCADEEKWERFKRWIQPLPTS